MSKFNTHVNNLSSGELSQAYLGNTDRPEYKTGAKRVYNWLVKPEGGGSVRGGTRYTADLSAMTGGPGLVPFIADRKTGYVVSIDPTQGAAAGNKLVRIHDSSGGACTVDETPFLNLNNTLYVLPTANIDPALFCIVQIADALFVTHFSGLYPPFVILRTGATTFEVHAYISPATNPYVGGFSIHTVLRVPFRAVNTSTITLTPSVTTGNGTLTSNTANFFQAGHKGAVFKLTHAGTTGSARITSIVSGLVANITVTKDFGATTATSNWEECAWSDYRGWPKVVVAFEQSLYFLGSKGDQVDTFWKSLTGNVYHMMSKRFAQDSAADTSGLNYFGSVAETDPASFTLSASEVNAISWATAGNNLNIGTLGREYIATGGPQEIFGLMSSLIKGQTRNGGLPAKALQMDDDTVFLTADGKSLRNFRYSEQNGSNVSLDLSIHANHMNRKGGSNYGFKDMCYQRSRSTIWFLNNNNHLVSLTYNQDTKTVAWAHHEIGEALSITGICSVPNSEGTGDHLFLMVKRTINGGTKYYLEQIGMEFEADSLGATPVVEGDLPYFLDSASRILITNPLGDDTLTGLSRLAGEEVTVTKDGFYLGVFTVSGGGEIDLGQTYPLDTSFIVGYPYDNELIFANISEGGDAGSAEGAIKRIDRAVLKFLRAYSVKVSGDNLSESLMETISFGDDISDEMVEKRVDLGSDPDLSVAVRVQVDGPYPCTVLGLAVRGQTYD